MSMATFFTSVRQLYPCSQFRKGNANLEYLPPSRFFSSAIAHLVFGANDYI